MLRQTPERCSGIQPQGITLTAEDRHKEGEHDQVTDEYLPRRFVQTQVPKTTAVCSSTADNVVLVQVYKVL